MRFVAKVATEDGPLARGTVEIVASDGRAIVAIGRGTVEAGMLAASADAGAIWGIRVDRRPVIAFPVSIEGDVVDLGEIVMVKDGVEWPAFHGSGGRVYGIPGAARPQAASPTPTEPIPRAPAGTVRSRMTFGELFGSTARQLKLAAIDRSAFTLAGATVTLKGVASATDEALSLEFPTPELVTKGVGFSELSFSLRPAQEAAVPDQPSAPVSTVPDLIDYTREFAERKSAAAGFVAEANYEITTDASLVGKVIRHVPPAGSALSPGGLIRVYIGKP